MERRSSFDRVAGLYDLARPTYPSELIDEVAALGPRVTKHYLFTLTLGRRA